MSILNFAYLITHQLIANNVLFISSFSLILLAGFSFIPKIKSLLLNPAISAAFGFFVVTAYLFGQSPAIPFWVMLLTSLALAAYLFLEIVLVPLTRSQIFILMISALTFFILHLPDGSITYRGLAVFFGGLLITKFVSKNRSRRFKIFSYFAASAAVFSATYFTHVYYAIQAEEILESIGSIPRAFFE